MQENNETTDLEDNKNIIPMQENNNEVETDSGDFKSIIPMCFLTQGLKTEEADLEDFKCIIPLEELNSDSEDFRDVFQCENATTMNSLPEISREKYLKEYSMFKAWCEEKKVEKVTEDVVLAYFFEKAKVMKSSSLWSKYSMLKTTLSIKDNINIKFPKLLAFLKHQSAGYKARKTETFTRDEINKFLLEAPDEKYLMIKVAFVLGVTGGCRCEELTRMSIDDIQDKESILVVRIPGSTTRIQRTFVVDGETNNGLNFVEIYRKYVALRSPKTEHRRLFVNYQDGKCTVQVVGRNTMAKIPSIVAKFLQKPNIDAYTGHCIRRTSATLFVDAGANVLSLKRRAGLRSATKNNGDECVESKRQATNNSVQAQESNKEDESSERSSVVVENNVDKCIESIRLTTNSTIQEQESNKDKTNESGGISGNDEDPNMSSNTDNNMSFSFRSLSNGAGITIHNANNCTFTININK